jgi:hypothetical protein
MLSKIEKLTREVCGFYLGNKDVIYNWRPDFLLNEETGRNLELDIWYPNLKIAIEVNGVYHKERKVAIRDLFKQRKCKKEGIKLISINNPKDLFLLGYKIGNNKKTPKIVIDEINKYINKKSKKYKELEKKIIIKNKNQSGIKKNKDLFKKDKEGIPKMLKYEIKQKEERLSNLKRLLIQGKITEDYYKKLI